MIKHRINSILKSGKANVFALFFILSLLFLLLTKFSANYSQTVRFKVQPKNIPEDKLILKDTAHYLDITLTANGFKFLSYYMSNSNLVIDIEELEKDDLNYFWVREKNLGQIVDQFESDILIDAIRPDTLYFTYDQSTVKMVPVEFKGQIKYREGYSNTGPVAIRPDSVKVIGPGVIIDTIMQLVTQDLVLENVSKSVNENLDLILPDVQKQVSFSHESVSVFTEVEKFTEGTVSVPVNVSNVPEDVGLTFYPKEVSVTYYTSLSNFDSISFEDFTITCDFNKLDNSTTFLVPVITKFPQGLKNLRLDTNKIEFILKQ